jgi:PAS domain S-box-containing protein
MTQDSPATVQANTPSLELLAKAIDTVDACVAILTGQDLRYTFVNRAYEAINPTVPMVGQRFRDVFPSAAEAGAEAKFREVLESGQPWRIQRYGAPLSFEFGAVWEGEAVRAEPISQGAPPSIVVIVRNVTETVRTEQALAESEEALRRTNDKLRATIDSITDGLLVLDRDWRYTMVSERAAKIIGLKADDLVGGCVWELFPHAEGTRFYEGYHQAMASGQPTHFEEYYPQPIDKWLECHCYPSADELTVYFRDVSEQRRADEALRESTALLQAISDTSTDMIFAKDERGCMRFANPATLALIGKPADEVLGRTDAEFLNDKEVARRVMENDRRVMDTRESAELEETVPLADGQEKIWLSRKLPFLDDRGEVIGLLGISRDITDRKRAEQDLRDANLRKDEFLAMLAHELRNPLAPITTGARLLELFAHDESRVRQASQIISRQAAHMVELVDDLLDVSRVTRGLIELQKEHIDIKSVLAHAVEQARPLIESRNHEFSTRMASAHVFVYGDRTRLVQAISNLLNNAAKYTPAGGQILLALSVDESRVKLCVTDSGVGISSELLPKVFDLFTQGERSPDRSQGGLGLGLALVKSIIAMHGGEVNAASGGPGTGSTFSISLPRSAQEEPAPSTTASLRAHDDAVQPATVMIVDDNIDAATSLAALLDAFGHKVVVKHDAQAALLAAPETGADVYILDIGLPDLDGYELARRLRAHPENAKAILIALTGYGQPNDRSMGRTAGFDHYLVKPVDIEKLTQLLATAASQGRAHVS